MSLLSDGARVLEELVRERAEARKVALTAVSWNGDEGLRDRADTPQTLFVSSTQKTGRLSLTRDQIVAASGGTADPAVSELVDRVLDDIHVLDESGEVPPGGGGTE
ncbi:MAG TPA: hypothetical protein VKA32_03085 [Gammaproteobacteria bacterium]|nr:hypothetical protein [Gammaproteobacteria bacterium]